MASFGRSVARTGKNHDTFVHKSLGEVFDVLRVSGVFKGDPLHHTAGIDITTGLFGTLDRGRSGIYGNGFCTLFQGDVSDQFHITHFTGRFSNNILYIDDDDFRGLRVGAPGAVPVFGNRYFNVRHNIKIYG